MTKVAVIDCQIAGIAGDMLMSALVDAGADQKKVLDAIFACPDSLKGSTIEKASFEKIKTHGFSATRLAISYRDGTHERTGAEMLSALSRTCDSLALEPKAKAFAQESLRTIIAAEAKIHGEDFESVHLHEASSIDTLADLVGCATALQDLKLFDARLYSTRVAVGGGTVKFSHGTVPNPADAILHIFQGKNFVLAGGQARDELTTPTGAAMLANLAQGSVDYYPAMTVEKKGYGAGTKEFAGFANVLRLVIGSSPAAIETEKDTVTMIETNIDDASGEVMGNLIERLTEAGAKDVTVIPGITKKSRPTYLVRVICDNALLDSMLSLLFGESGTLGARVQHVERFVLPRTILTVPVNIAGNAFNVHVKVVKDSAGKTVSAKPEFEDIKIIAARTGMPARRVIELISAQVAEKTGT
jgi:hypothetical protein